MRINSIQIKHYKTIIDLIMIFLESDMTIAEQFLEKSYKIFKTNLGEADPTTIKMKERLDIIRERQEKDH